MATTHQNLLREKPLDVDKNFLVLVQAMAEGVAAPDEEQKETPEQLQEGNGEQNLRGD